MLVSEAVGRTLHRLGGDVVFGLMGSGNLAVTNAIVAAGGRFVSARHETGALCMADGYARVSGRLGVARVHQGPGLTNAITGLTEAAKSRTPLILLAADTPAGAAALELQDRPGRAGRVRRRGGGAGARAGDRGRRRDARRAAAVVERRAVVLMLPLDVQAAEVEPTEPRAVARARRRCAARRRCRRSRTLLARAERPAIIGGRGAVLSGAGPALRRLGELSGAVLATSAVANGLFAGDPFAVGISGGFATPLGQRLLAEADVIVAFGASLNVWTTRHGALVADAHARAGRPRRGGDRRAPAGRPRRRRRRARDRRGADRGARRARRGDDLGGARRSVALAAEIAGGAWRDEPYEPSRDWLDPRDLSDRARRDAAAPSARWSSTPARSWATRRCTCGCRTPQGFVFPQAFQCVGLGAGQRDRRGGRAAGPPDRGRGRRRRRC